jgi:hypothetical protein
LGFRGTEGLEVDFEVTRAHVETSPLWRLLNWGIEFFHRKNISCSFVWFRGWRILGIQELEVQRGIRGIRGAEGLEGFFTSLHHSITKKSSKAKVQSSKLKVLLRF